MAHLCALLCALLVATLAPAAPARAQAADTYAPAEVVAYLRAAGDLPAVAAAYGLAPAPLGQFGSRPIYRLAIVDGSPPAEKAAQLAADGRVQAAEPNFFGQTPEGRGRLSWATVDGASGYGAQWAPQTIRLPEAHAAGFTGAGVTVAVLDTGVDASHPALAGRVGPGFDVVDLDADPREEGADSDLAFGHGTHVAGLVALAAPGAQIMPVRMLAPDGSGNLWTTIEALRYAVDPDGDPATDDGADVINMSFSFLRPSSILEGLVRELTCDDDDDDDDSDGASLCQASGGRGVVFVSAAGNGGSATPEYPAGEQVDGQLAVGASTRKDALARFSNYGPWVSLAAPGEAIVSSLPGGRYASWSGTSMAAPLVAGAAALLRGADPGLDADDVAEQIVDTAAAIRGDVPLRLDAAAALGLASACPGKGSCGRGPKR